MKFLILAVLGFGSLFGSVSAHAGADSTGNVCTIALFEKDSDAYGNPVPGAALGVTSFVNSSGASTEFAKLHSVSKRRAVIAAGAIGMDGFLRLVFQEVDQDKHGKVTLANPVQLTKDTFFYSPYPEYPAANKPVIVEFDRYVATVSCILYQKR